MPALVHLVSALCVLFVTQNKLAGRHSISHVMICKHEKKERKKKTERKKERERGKSWYAELVSERSDCGVSFYRFSFCLCVSVSVSLSRALTRSCL